MNRLNRYKTGLVCCFLFALQGCTQLAVMSDAEKGSPAPGEVIVVGKFELTPSLPKSVKEAAGKRNIYGTGDYLDKVLFSTTSQPVKDIDDTMRSRQWSETLSARWGKTYFKQTKARKTYLNAGTFYIDTNSADHAWVPGGMSFTPPPGARAVYIGTVRYTHDDFYNITKIQLIDEYRSAKSQFEKRFGTSIKLKKALLR